METPTVASLADRLDRLERENLLLKRAGALLVGGAMVLLVVGTNLVRAPREVSAERFVLKDEHGRSRAMLSLKYDLAPALALMDESGRDQVLLRAMPDGSSALEYFEDQAPRVAMTSQTGSAASISLFDRDGRSRAGLSLADDGTTGLELLRDRRGAALNVSPGGSAKLSFSDRKGRERGGLGLSAEGALIRFDAADAASVSDSAPKPEKPGRPQDITFHAGMLGEM